MILSDRSIRGALLTGEINVEPSVSDADIRPNGIRVHLSDRLLIPPLDEVVDPTAQSELAFREQDISRQPFVIERGAFVLGATKEAVRLSRTLTCHIDGRSTLARLGLMVHCSSSAFDNVHDETRTPTLELINLGPFKLILRHNMAIAMLQFTRLTSEIEQPSQAQYRGQSGPQGPNLKFKIGDRDEQ